VQDLADLRSTVCSGLSEVIGSWKIMVMSLPRTGAISFVIAQKVLALEQDLTGGVMAAG
jgi:hypothetical protein